MFKLEKNKMKVLMSGIALVIILGSAIFMLVITDRNKNNQGDQSNTPVSDSLEDLSGNKIVIQSEGSQTAEGRNLPTDINFALMVPRELGQENLVGVVDNKQAESRNITLKYKVAGTEETVKNSLISSLASLNWELEQQQTDYITARKIDSRIAINLDQVDDQSVYATVLLNLYDK